jgi:ATP-dependent Lon protease
LYIETSLKQPVESGDGGKEGSAGSLQLTGHLGDVMKESAQIAYTVAKSFLINIEPDNKFLQKGHLHLHVPEVHMNRLIYCTLVQAIH